MVDPKEDKLHRISVTGIVWEKEGGVRRYLITKRALTEKAWPGKWTVPGGGVEVDDYIHEETTFPNDENPQWYGSIERALRREVKEEVDLEIEDIHYLLDITSIRPDGIPILILSYYCKSKGGEVTLDKDSIEYAWIRVDETEKYDLIQGIDHEIEMVDELLAKL